MNEATSAHARRMGAWGSILIALGCGQSPFDTPAAEGGTSTGQAGEETSAASTSDASTGGDSGETGTTPDDPGDDRFWITHAFDPMTMLPYEDNDSRCVSWTLDNVLPVYVQSVLAANEGGYHHSNWFIVPDDVYDGPDGTWPCAERGFTEIDAGTKGTAMFAQSTQSWVEEQNLTPGAVVKIPAHSRIVAGVHTLNTSPREETSGLWLSLEPIHPADVTTVVTPLALQYKDLHIAPGEEARFTARCDLATPAAITTLGQPFSLKLHYLLPHYHYLGNYFDVTVIGGELDGQSVFQLDGFNADANGQTYDPPLDLPGATGLAMTCGYDNWTSQNVEWGNGQGEMCVMMALVETDTVIGASVELGNSLVGADGDIHLYEGPCFGIAVNKSEDQGMPTEQERLAPLYLPPLDPEDQGLPPIPECHDADPSATAELPATLTSLKETVFAPACSFASCHGQSAAGQLNLMANDLHAELLEHTVLVNPTMPLVDPGNPENSWLYHLLSECEPTLPGGAVVSHMPKNAPKLLDDELVAKVRAWIEAGAPND